MQCQTEKNKDKLLSPIQSLESTVTLCKTLLLLSKQMSKSGFCDYIKILNLNLHLTFGSVNFCNIAFSAVCFAR